MTIYGERGPADRRPPGGRAPLLREVGALIARRLRRASSSTRDPRPDDAAFERHVEQALSIARAVPTLRIVPAEPGRAARS